jgi:hypothetical protein
MLFFLKKNIIFLPQFYFIALRIWVWIITFEWIHLCETRSYRSLIELLPLWEQVRKVESYNLGNS